MRIFFNKGVAHKREGLNKVNVSSIDLQSPCDDCGISVCNPCHMVFTDLDGSGNKFVLAVLGGELIISAYDDFQTFKESGDTDDLNETVVGTQS